MQLRRPTSGLPASGGSGSVTSSPAAKIVPLTGGGQIRLDHEQSSAVFTNTAVGFILANAPIGKTALHAAAMEGWLDAARVLLARGASVAVRDREFEAQPLIWAAEGAQRPQPGREHVAVGRLLLDAGSPVNWQQGKEPSEGIVDIVNDWRRSA